MTWIAALVLGVGCVDSAEPAGGGSDDGESTITPAAYILNGPQKFQCSTASCSYDLSVNNEYGTCFLAGLKGRPTGTASHWGGASVNAHSTGEMFLDMAAPLGGTVTATIVCVQNNANKHTYEFDSFADPSGYVDFSLPDPYSLCFLTKYKKFDNLIDPDELAVYSYNGNMWAIGDYTDVHVVGEAVCVDFSQNLGTQRVYNEQGYGTDNTVVLYEAPSDSVCGLSAIDNGDRAYEDAGNANGGELVVHTNLNTVTWDASIGSSGDIDVQCGR